MVEQGLRRRRRQAEDEGSSPESSFSAYPALEPSNQERLANRRTGQAQPGLTGAGQPLPQGLRERAEQTLGLDLSAVRLHQGSAAQAAAASLNAEAFALGADLWLGADAPALGSTQGQELLLHELAHVAQGARGEARGQGVSDPTSQLERQASEVALLPEVVPNGPVSAGAPVSRQVLRSEEEPASGATTQQLLEIIALFSAELAELVQQGVVPYLVTKGAEQLGPSLPGGPEGADPASLLTDLTSFLLKVATGDPACCEAIGAWVEGLRAPADHFLRNGWTSRLSDLAGSATAALGESLAYGEDLFRSWAQRALNAAGFTEFLAKMKDKPFYKELTRLLGVAADFDPATLAVELATQAWNAVVGQLNPILAEAKALLDLSLPLSHLAQVCKFFVDLGDGLLFLIRHVGDPSLVLLAHEELGEHWLRKLLDAHPTVAAILAGSMTTLVDLLNDLEAGGTALAALAHAVPLAGLFIGHIVMVVKAIRAVLPPPEWEVAWESFLSFGEATGEVLWSVLRVIVSIPLYTNDPLALNALLAAEALALVPDCYLAPLLDLALTWALLLVDSVAVPVMAAHLGTGLGTALLPAMHHGILDGLELARALPPAQAAEVVRSFCRTLSGGSFADFLLGILGGFVVQPFVDLKDLLVANAQIQGSLNLLLAEMLLLQPRMIVALKESDFQLPQAPALDPGVAEPDLADPTGSVLRLTDLLGGLWGELTGSLQEGLAQVIASVADLVVDYGEGCFELGWAVGTGLGALYGGAVLKEASVLAKGAGPAVHAAVEALVLALNAGEDVAAVGKAALQDGLKALQGALPVPSASVRKIPVLGTLYGFVDTLLAKLSELIRLLLHVTTGPDLEEARRMAEALAESSEIEKAAIELLETLEDDAGAPGAAELAKMAKDYLVEEVDAWLTKCSGLPDVDDLLDLAREYMADEALKVMATSGERAALHEAATDLEPDGRDLIAYNAWRSLEPEQRDRLSPEHVAEVAADLLRPWIADKYPIKLPTGFKSGEEEVEQEAERWLEEATRKEALAQMELEGGSTSPPYDPDGVCDDPTPAEGEG